MLARLIAGFRRPPLFARVEPSLLLPPAIVIDATGDGASDSSRDTDAGFDSGRCDINDSAAAPLPSQPTAPPPRWPEIAQPEALSHDGRLNRPVPTLTRYPHGVRLATVPLDRHVEALAHDLQADIVGADTRAFTLGEVQTIYHEMCLANAWQPANWNFVSARLRKRFGITRKLYLRTTDANNESCRTPLFHIPPATAPALQVAA